MKFWDTSAIVPLLVTEPTSAQMNALIEQDPNMLVWWGSEIECASAVSRLGRSGALDRLGASEALRRLAELANGWVDVDPSDRLKESAIRFLRVHSLRAADALQLAAAFVGADGQPDSLAFVTLDTRLAQAAAVEGFQLIGA